MNPSHLFKLVFTIAFHLALQLAFPFAVTMIASGVFFAQVAHADDRSQPNPDYLKITRDAKDWSAFDKAMGDLRSEEHRTGVSYVISGTLVTVGSLVAPFSTNDTATKFVYGLAQGVGVAAIGYGIAKLADSSEFDSFYESLRNSTIREDQKTALVQSYLERERQRRERLRKISLYSHLSLGAMNVYSAIAERDKNAKVFMGFLASVNFALAFSCSF